MTRWKDNAQRRCIFASCSNASYSLLVLPLVEESNSINALFCAEMSRCDFNISVAVKFLF